jgi:uncharacterized protein YbaR (Trm112 family)
MQIDDSILSQLACPACQGDLRLEGQSVVCVACGRRYPTVDGIPVLIVERAEWAPADPRG